MSISTGMNISLTMTMTMAIVVEPEPSGAALFGRSRKKGAAPASYDPHV